MKHLLAIKILKSINHAHELIEQFRQGGDIQHSNDAIPVLESTPEDHPARHYMFSNLALILRRRVEIRVSTRRKDTLLEPHTSPEGSLVFLRKAVYPSPAALNIKVKYFSHLGRTVVLWSTLLAAGWAGEVDQVLQLLKTERESAKN